MVTCLHTDLVDITKSYLSARGSFWMALSGGAGGGPGGCPANRTSLPREETAGALLLVCALTASRRADGKNAIFQFVLDQGYSKVVLETSIVQYSPVALY